jgi:hypothetical protein
VLQVIAVICVLVWIMNINRFSDPALGGWVSGERYIKTTSLQLQQQAEL